MAVRRDILQDRIDLAFAELKELLGVPAGTTSLNESPEIAQRLGKAVYAYLLGNICDVQWEGLNDRDLEAVRRLLQDFNECLRSGL